MNSSLLVILCTNSIDDIERVLKLKFVFRNTTITCEDIMIQISKNRAFSSIFNNKMADFFTFVLLYPREK